jgi:hypothetical protein
MTAALIIVAIFNCRSRCSRLSFSKGRWTHAGRPALSLHAAPEAGVSTVSDA